MFVVAAVPRVGCVAFCAGVSAGVKASAAGSMVAKPPFRISKSSIGGSSLAAAMV